MKTSIDTIEIELTQNCTLKCDYCFIQKVLGKMSEKTFNNTINYVIQISKLSTADNLDIVFTGGEPSLFNLDLLSDAITKLKKNIQKSLNIIFQTNLTYNLSHKKIQLLKQVDTIAISWDYKQRFTTNQEEILFFSNLKEIRKLNKHIEMGITVTDDLIKNVTPEMFMSFLMVLEISEFILNRLYKPSPFSQEEFKNKMTVKNEQIREWLFKLFKLYLEVKKTLDISIFGFDVLIDAFNGIHRNQYSKKCVEHIIHINPVGEVTRCIDFRANNFGNVNLNTFDEEKYILIKRKHIDYKFECCNTCKYFKYCQCGCPWMYYDDTGCSVPYKAFDYLKLLTDLEDRKI